MMNKYLSKILFTILLTSVHLFSFAQKEQVEMADTFRAEGKIYVVIGVFVIIVIVLFVYLFTIDRKIRRLEDQINQ